MDIIVIACPGCGEYASLDGKYRLECLGRTIAPKESNGFQPHCSACAKAIADWRRDEAARLDRDRSMLPRWAQ